MEDDEEQGSEEREGDNPIHNTDHKKQRTKKFEPESLLAITY